MSLAEATTRHAARRPLVSVLIPVYNAHTTLRRALTSLQRQHYSHWECVLVDDGSTDLSAHVARGFSAQDPRFRLCTEPHRGIVAALNTGLGLCRGEFVARFDADDLMHPERLEQQVRALTTDVDLDAVGCHVQLFPRRSLSPKRLAYQHWLNSLFNASDVFRDRFVECPVAHPSLLLRRKTLEHLGYRSLGWAEDYDLVLRLLQTGPRVGVVPLPLLAWRDGRARLSRTDENYGLERFTRCKAHFLAATWLSGRNDYVLWGHGDTGRSLRRALAEQGKSASLIVDVHPGRIGQVIHGCRVVHPEQLHATNAANHKIVASVAGLAARSDLRTIAARIGLVEGRDYIVAA